MKIVIVNGAPGSGKSTFEHFCEEAIGEGYWWEVSTVSLVKYIAELCGWDGQKTPEARKFLSDLKKFLSDTPFGNVPFNDVMDEAERFKNLLRRASDPHKLGVVFVDCREPEEIQKFVEKTGAIAVYVRNDDAEAREVSNSSDAHVKNFSYHYYVTNNGSLNDLDNEAKKFVEWLGMFE